MLVNVRITSVWLLGIAAVSLSACSSDTDRAGVSGTVTYNGQMVETGLIEFFPIEGTSGPSTGGVIEQGEYSIPADKGPLVDGTYQVRIIGSKVTGRTFVDRDRPNQPVEVRTNFIPAMYNTESTLKAKITSDPSQNRFDFQLQPPLAGNTRRGP